MKYDVNDHFGIGQTSKNPKYLETGVSVILHIHAIAQYILFIHVIQFFVFQKLFYFNSFVNYYFHANSYLKRCATGASWGVLSK